MDARTLDRKIELFKMGPPIDDGYTSLPGDWESQGTRRARYIPAMAKEVFANAGNEEQMPVVFECRFDSVTREVDATWRLTFEGRLYNIKGSQEIGRRAGVRIDAMSGDSIHEADS